MLLLGPFYILQQLLLKDMHWRRHQVRTYNVAFVSQVEVDVGDVADDLPHKRSQRHSKTAFKAHSKDPTQLHFYPDRWQEVLTEAKILWRFWMTMNWGFPNLREHGNEIKECISSAITAYQEEGGLLDTGKSYISYLKSYLPFS